MTEHLPALQIAVPLIAAPLCILIRQPQATRLWAILGVLLTLLEVLCGSVGRSREEWKGVDMR